MSFGTLYVIVYCLLVLNDIAGVRQVSALPTPTAFRSKISKESRPANTNQPTTNGFTAINKKMFVCPPLPQIVVDCRAEPDHECQTDQDCNALHHDGDQVYKCCRDGCDMICLPGIPTTPRPAIKRKVYPAIDKKMATCPIFPVFKECPSYLDDECKTDQDCDALDSGDEIFKCCRDGCEMRCLPAIPPPPTPAVQISKESRPAKTNQPTTNVSTAIDKKMFVCPKFAVPVECPADRDDECQTDQDCDGLDSGDEVFKCCRDGCDMRCLPGVIQVSALPTPTAIRSKISKESRPAKTVQPTTNVSTAIDKKMFVCPSFQMAAECPPEPDHECQTDQDCDALHHDGDEIYKCCADGCERRCYPGIPTTPKPAIKKVFVCPRISGVVCCEAEPDNDCATDEDCDALYRNSDEIFKCCADGCNFKCLPGVVTTVIEPKYSPAIDKRQFHLLQHQQLRSAKNLVYRTQNNRLQKFLLLPIRNET